jgi:hypothetical protein
VTNLGPVPPGMTFLQATRAMKPQRKFEIDYYAKGNRLTICDTLRHMWREVDKLPNSETKATLREYIAASVDYAKRMDLRMKELKAERPDA